ncbi:MAG: hypothetical protein GY723_05560 [bacterium]|nr:hypothetical protein [bacterium]MCP5070732.1 hypothetical protein [bacterium]
MRIHAVLVRVHGVGVLIRGPSGVGKSETALELIQRGHCLVADDVVEIEVGDDGFLTGGSPELIRHHMEIRGIGLLYVPELFGEKAVVDRARIELICRMEHWRDGEAYERIGHDRPRERVAGLELPAVILPVRPSGSMATLVEVAVRDHLQRSLHGSAAERFDQRFRAGT